MTRLLPQFFRVEQRRLDFLERFALTFTYKAFQRVVQLRALGRPENGAGCHRIQVEQIELLAKHAMIALSCFFKIMQVRVNSSFLKKAVA